MRAYDLIAKKRDGGNHSKEELAFFINGYLSGTVMDAQMSAWLMAVYFQGMNQQEMIWLTDIMEHSGDTIDLSAINGTVVDKHSTGGVGDKTTLIVAPLAAACGVPVAKLSGRGLGFTGGTIDKLEAIPGFCTNLSPADFLNQVNTIGVAIVGQTQNLVPADKKIYALRDLTATVESIPLIASSIMSKKLASGASKIVLDVKCGSGAFMQQPEQAKLLARTMVEIGKGLGRETVAIISSMEEPLGFAVGNSLEMEEAIATLQGQGPEDLKEVCLILAGYMIYLSGHAVTAQDGYTKAAEALFAGKAYAKFLEMVAAQGGDINTIYSGRLPKATLQQTLSAPAAGYLMDINAKEIGHCSMLLGAGREAKDAAIDLTAGIKLHKKRGDAVKKGEALATLYYNPFFEPQAAEVSKRLISAYHIGSEMPSSIPLILKILD